MFYENCGVWGSPLSCSLSNPIANDRCKRCNNLLFK